MTLHVIRTEIREDRHLRMEELALFKLETAQFKDEDALGPDAVYHGDGGDSDVPGDDRFDFASAQQGRNQLGRRSLSLGPGDAHDPTRDWEEEVGEVEL
jgi:hypothetical protein